MIVWITFGSNLLSCFKVSNLLFSSMYATHRHTQAVVTLEIRNSCLDHLGTTHFLEKLRAVLRTKAK